MADINIEETNKIRVALGMKPLPVPGASTAGGPVLKQSPEDDGSSADELASTLETRQAQAGQNWKKLQDEADAKANRQAQREAIKKARDAAQRFAKLEGTGLGDASGEAELDTKTWLMQQRKRQKKIAKARRLEEQLAEREREQQAQYSAVDLSGVKVGHELSQFEEGSEQILTLKDAAVDDEDEDDELENVTLRDQEKVAERLESRKQRSAYNPNELDETGPVSILGQYDEEIHGKRRKRFTLDGHGRTQEEASAAVGGDGGRSKPTQISLDLLNDKAPVSDYLDASQVKIRKPKSKKSRATRKRSADEDSVFLKEATLPPSLSMEMSMDMDTFPANGTTGGHNNRGPDKATFVDDEDLQATLALQRREVLRKRRKVRPEDIAKQLKEDTCATPGLPENNEADEDTPGLVIDETSEFVDRLQKPTFLEQQRQRPSKPSGNGIASISEHSPGADAEGDIEMLQAHDELDSEQEQTPREARNVSVTAEIPASGIDEEATLDRGVGSALALLTQRGLVQTSTSGDSNALHRERQRFLAEKQRREAEAEKKARLQRERDRQSGRLDRMSAREREEYARWNNVQREQAESRQMAEIFNREYKPDVQINYVDDFGRHMTQKEAFKHLSHQFHGKGSGKQKTEKKLKKIEDEKRREATSTLDSSQSTGMNNAMGATAKKNRQAGVRLQ